MILAGKTVLVLGGSGAFGSLLTQQLAAQFANVLATCSGPDSAPRIPDQAQLKLLVDLTNPESITTLTNYLNATTQLDGIVIASGRVGFGLAGQTREQDAETLMRINHLGPAQLISELSANLGRASEPFIAAITGVVAEKVFPGMPAYTASKMAFSGWLQSLRLELRNTQILEARPPHTETGLATRPLFGQSPNLAQGLAPTQVVNKIIDAITTGKTLLTSADF